MVLFGVIDVVIVIVAVVVVDIMSVDVVVSLSVRLATPAWTTASACWAR